MEDKDEMPSGIAIGLVPEIAAGGKESEGQYRQYPVAVK